jgi:hypothetical protein
MLTRHPGDLLVLKEARGIKLKDSSLVPITSKAKYMCETHGINNVHNTRKAGRVIPDEGERNARMGVGQTLFESN